MTDEQRAANTDGPVHATSVVTLGAWDSNGAPVPFTTSAVCAECGRWATHVLTSGHGDATGEPHRARISRSTTVVVYACPEHYERVINSLVEEFGHASNRYEPDDLALEVDRRARQAYREPPKSV